MDTLFFIACASAALCGAIPAVVASKRDPGSYKHMFFILGFGIIWALLAIACAVRNLKP